MRARALALSTPGVTDTPTRRAVRLAWSLSPAAPCVRRRGPCPERLLRRLVAHQPQRRLDGQREPFERADARAACAALVECREEVAPPDPQVPHVEEHLVGLREPRRAPACAAVPQVCLEALLVERKARALHRAALALL